MKRRSPFRGAIVVAAVLLLAAGIIRWRAEPAWGEPGEGEPAYAADESDESEMEEEHGLLPDQSTAMVDVGYHFANLWFAGRAENWPLAEFYLSETRAHLKWAVRIKPVRKDAEGRDLDLPAILQSIDASLLQPLAGSIEAQDAQAFEDGYRLMLERGCYQCHKTVGKPYLRPQVPDQPPQPIINFDPRATWPE